MKEQKYPMLDLVLMNLNNNKCTVKQSENIRIRKWPLYTANAICSRQNRRHENKIFIFLNILAALKYPRCLGNDKK